jgi:hypothetical protein
LPQETKQTDSSLQSHRKRTRKKLKTKNLQKIKIIADALKQMQILDKDYAKLSKNSKEMEKVS